MNFCGSNQRKSKYFRIKRSSGGLVFTLFNLKTNLVVDLFI